MRAEFECMSHPFEENLIDTLKTSFNDCIQSKQELMECLISMLGLVIFLQKSRKIAALSHYYQLFYTVLRKVPYFSLNKHVTAQRRTFDSCDYKLYLLSEMWEVAILRTAL